MTYKCKICGGQTILDIQSGIATCEYCGTKQALPLFTADSERLLYDRGNNYLNHSEYDKAENVFNQLLTIKPGAAELYWDLVLCKYGVTYVKDPKTGKYIPTCNRTHYIPIFSDENYKKAIEMSSGEKKALFEEDAKTIDNIQKGIIAVSKKEKPFDIFISYKETDANGNRTKDSIEAQRLYEKLTEAGYKVFFSRITLEDKIGAEYEPYIYAALHSSKVMLTICSSKENIEAVWVKNEWSRFLEFRQNDNSKTLLPLYFDMDRADLPEEFTLLSAYNMHTDGFEDELLRGIKKLIPLPIMKAKRRKQRLKATGIIAASFVLAAGIVAAIIIPKEMEERRIAAETAALEKETEDAYQAAMTLFDNADYTAAEAAFTALGDYKDSAHMATRCPIQPEYDAAMQLYYDEKYAQATWAFEALGDYEDAAQMRDNAESTWREKLATVATYNVLDMVEMERYGAYYVSANGAVKCFPNFPGTANTGIEINAHGKIVSIASNYNLYALYEDGYVYNSAKNNDLDLDWENVIQITPVFNSTNVALKNDGTVIYGNLQNRYWEDVTDNWLKPTSTWKDIISLSWHIERDMGGCMNCAVLTGVDKAGKAHFVYYSSTDADVSSETEGVIDSLNNIKEIAANIRMEINLDYHNDIYTTQLMMNFVALDEDNTLIVYRDGQLSKSENTNYVDVAYTDDVYVLTNKGEYKLLNSPKVILEDVVELNDECVITRSGTIYRLFYESVIGTESKTKVKDVWLEGK